MPEIYSTNSYTEISCLTSHEYANNLKQKCQGVIGAYKKMYYATAPDPTSSTAQLGTSLNGSDRLC